MYSVPLSSEIFAAINTARDSDGSLEEFIKLDRPYLRLDCTAFEIDYIASFESGDQIVRKDDGGIVDLPEFWKPGKASYVALQDLLERKFSSERDFKLVCYLLTSMFYMTMEAACDKGDVRFDNGAKITKDEIKDFEPFVLITQFVKPMWPVFSGELKRFVVALIHIHILQSIDVGLVTYLADGARNMMLSMNIIHGYNGCLEWIDSDRTIKSKNAAKAGKARHAETEWIKEQAYDYYDKHKGEFRSLRHAATDHGHYRQLSTTGNEDSSHGNDQTQPYHHTG